jgi:hypothetical protein
MALVLLKVADEIRTFFKSFGANKANELPITSNRVSISRA